MWKLKKQPCRLSRSHMQRKYSSGSQELLGSPQHLNSLPATAQDAPHPSQAQLQGVQTRAEHGSDLPKAVDRGCGARSLIVTTVQSDWLRDQGSNVDNEGTKEERECGENDESDQGLHKGDLTARDTGWWRGKSREAISTEDEMKNWCEEWWMLLKYVQNLATTQESCGSA
ncbi:hypothetical protein NDU88_002462 [Pleurodeles waltl]|uniref:Uncharacterized protein n=1 Tax=Pleurodeles waltl TaxID=8319 RepID=A0AAV7KW62_PLEWA|nr:hypothetical protein NDU88_002462 [Pleurodeles waltl]